MPSYSMTLQQVADFNGGNIGLDDYPIFDEAYRDGLNKKIYDHFMNQEIGQETDSLFIHAMKRKMNEIMPYYNQLYISEQLTIDPLSTVNIATVNNTSATSNGTRSDNSTTNTTGSNESSSESNAASRTVNSDTPQTRLAGDADYASSMSDATSGNTATGSATETGESTTAATGEDSNTSTGDSTGSTTGWQGSQAELLQAYRATFLNIDQMILDDLRELFMLVWQTNDSVTDSYPYGGYYGYGYYC